MAVVGLMPRHWVMLIVAAAVEVALNVVVVVPRWEVMLLGSGSRVSKAGCSAGGGGRGGGVGGTIDALSLIHISEPTRPL